MGLLIPLLDLILLYLLKQLTFTSLPSLLKKASFSISDVLKTLYYRENWHLICLNNSGRNCEQINSYHLLFIFSSQVNYVQQFSMQLHLSHIHASVKVYCESLILILNCLKQFVNAFVEKFLFFIIQVISISPNFSILSFLLFST